MFTRLSFDRLFALHLICQILVLSPKLLETFSDSPYLCLYFEVFALPSLLADSVLGLTLRSLMNFKLIFVQADLVLFFYMWASGFPSTTY